eukprot:66344-Alexandrium_andersonii.AAC.1
MAGSQRCRVAAALEWSNGGATPICQSKNHQPPRAEACVDSNSSSGWPESKHTCKTDSPNAASGGGGNIHEQCAQGPTQAEAAKGSGEIRRWARPDRALAKY